MWGEVGKLTVSQDQQKIQCHVCGLYRQEISTHILYVHALTADTYRELFGLPAGVSLKACRAPKSNNAKTHTHDINYQNLLQDDAFPTSVSPMILKTYRSTMNSQKRHSLSRGRTLGEIECQNLIATPTLNDWANVAQGLLLRGASYSTLAQASGITPTEVSQRLENYLTVSVKKAWDKFVE